MQSCGPRGLPTPDNKAVVLLVCVAVWRHHTHICGEDGLHRAVPAWFPHHSVQRPFPGQAVSGHVILKSHTHSQIMIDAFVLWSFASIHGLVQTCREAGLH